ncbi:MAG: hypothetical protein DIJKHBIC_01151 [Thermoanaerobaculia bacterium]|nr:hypothetical protein [Thermoanaerobaculia bacterium]
MPRSYSFVTVWHLDAPVDRLWDALLLTERWPEWWPSVTSVVELQPGGPDGLGSVRRFSWKGRLPYSLSFDMRLTELVSLLRISGIASGELQGQGTWLLDPAGETTRVTYTWTVHTTKPWMNLLAPVLGFAFRWNHDYVMNTGGVGLARHLGCRLISQSERAA